MTRWRAAWTRDVSYSPASDDWWININTLSGGVAQETYVTTTTNVAGDGPGNFSVGNDSWQLTIKDALAAVVFGPAGEGVQPDSGIGSDEVFKLEEDPSPYIHPHSDYSDGTSSTFGAPNIYANGTAEQDFTDLRSAYEPCEFDTDCDDGNPCTDDTCDAFNGCMHGDLADGTSCDDGEFCNGAETCQGGVCTDGIEPCVNLAHCDEMNDICLHCIADSECDDDNPCTDDACVDDDCANTVVVNDTPCPDGDVCNGEETCQSGVCTSGTALDCDDGNPCTDDSCDAFNGCEYSDVANGSSCDDGLYCNGAETCQGGFCTDGTTPCEDACEQCDEERDTCNWCIYDLDGDGFIGPGDFSFFAGCYGGSYGCDSPDYRSGTEQCCIANFDESSDSFVGPGDFAGFAGCFGLDCDECATCWGSRDGKGRGGEPDYSGAAVAIELVALSAPSQADVLEKLPASNDWFVVGEEFYVELWASAGAGGQGLAAVHVDVRFDSARLAIEELIPSASFSLFAHGSLGGSEVFQEQSGMIEAVGGCAPLNEESLGVDSWVRVATLRVSARRAGPATVKTVPSTDGYGIAIMNQLGLLDAREIEFGGSNFRLRADVEATTIIRKP